MSIVDAHFAIGFLVGIAIGAFALCLWLSDSGASEPRETHHDDDPAAWEDRS